MAKVAVFFFALFVFLLATGVVAAQPLGLRPGMTLAEVRTIAPAARPVPNNPHLYDATSVKGGDDNTYDRYMFVITPRKGLCKTTLIGRTIDTNSFGAQLRIVLPSRTPS